MPIYFPDAAKCTSDLDFVLLTSKISYKCNFAKLAAEEKGANWKNFEINY